MSCILENIPELKIALAALGVGAVSAGGIDTQLQYNDGGALGGITGVTYNDGTGELGLDPTLLTVEDMRSQTETDSGWRFTSRVDKSISTVIASFEFEQNTAGVVPDFHSKWYDDAGDLPMYLDSKSGILSLATPTGNDYGTQLRAVSVTDLGITFGNMSAIGADNITSDNDGYLAYNITTGEMILAANAVPWMKLNDTTNKAVVSFGIGSGEQDTNYGVFFSMDTSAAGTTIGPFSSCVAGGAFIATSGVVTSPTATAAIGAIGNPIVALAGSGGWPGTMADVWGLTSYPVVSKGGGHGSKTLTRGGGLYVGAGGYEGFSMIYTELFGAYIEAHDPSGTVDSYGLYIEEATAASGINASIWVADAGKQYFRDSAIYVSSEADGYLDLTADTAVRINDDLEIEGDLDHDGSNIGFFGTAPATQAAAYTRNATVVESRTLLANASATAANNNAVLAALIADLQSYGLLQ